MFTHVNNTAKPSNASGRLKVARLTLMMCSKWPPVAWSVSRQLALAKTLQESGNMWNQSGIVDPGIKSYLTIFSHGAGSRSPVPQEHIPGPYQLVQSISRRSLQPLKFI